MAIEEKKWLRDQDRLEKNYRKTKRELRAAEKELEAAKKHVRRLENMMIRGETDEDECVDAYCYYMDALLGAKTRRKAHERASKRRDEHMAAGAYTL